MNCMETQDTLVLIHDGEASPEQVDAAHLHLSECPSCRAEADALRQINVWCHEEPPPEPSETWDLALTAKLGDLKMRAATEEIRLLRQIAEEMATRIRALETAQAAERLERDLMNVNELALYLHVTPEKVRDLLPEIPHIALGGDVRFRRAAVDGWLQLRESAPAEAPLQWNDWVIGAGSHLSS